MRSPSRRNLVACRADRIQSAPPSMPTNPLHPKKLLLTKWTAVEPRNREKHIVVSRVAPPEEPGGAVPWVEIEAVHSGRTRRIAWRDLRDSAVWKQGWV